jgi:hypothetical protein
MGEQPGMLFPMRQFHPHFRFTTLQQPPIPSLLVFQVLMLPEHTPILHRTVEVTGLTY